MITVVSILEAMVYIDIALPSVATTVLRLAL